MQERQERGGMGTWIEDKIKARRREIVALIEDLKKEREQIINKLAELEAQSADMKFWDERK